MKNLVFLLEDEQSDDAASEEQQDRVRLLGSCQEEGGKEEHHAYAKGEWIFGRRAEVLLVHQEYGCGCYQSDDGRTQTREDIFHQLGILVSDEVAADENHHDERQPHDAQ